MTLYYDEILMFYYLISPREDVIDGYIISICFNSDRTCDCWHDLRMDEFIKLSPCYFEIRNEGIL